jgi:hypothetical protein
VGRMVTFSRILSIFFMDRLLKLEGVAYR